MKPEFEIGQVWETSRGFLWHVVEKTPASQFVLRLGKYGRKQYQSQPPAAWKLRHPAAPNEARVCPDCGGMKMHHSDHSPNGFEKCMRCDGTGEYRKGVKFDLVVPFLARRRFVKREFWKDSQVLVFGDGDIGWLQVRASDGEFRSHRWIPNLQELNAEDWQVLPHQWEGKKDDYRPLIYPEL